MLKISNDQRRARLASRHALATPVSDPVDVADGLVVLHATDPASVYLSVHARTVGFTVEDIQSALFDDRSLMRTLAMRRTLFVGSRRILPIIEMSSSGDIARKERAILEKYLTASAIDDPTAWLATTFDAVLEALDGSDGFPARELTKRVPLLATRITMGSGRNTQEAGATSRVLGLMAVEGLLARGRTAGSWTGRQYDWHRRDQWLPHPDSLPSVADASTELLRLWLRSFGPGTMTDLTWWTGWTKTKTRAAMGELDLVEVSLEGGESGFILADDVEEVDDPGPWVAALPALDPTSMGWKDRSWYVGEHTPALFDRNGNIGPTIWCDGRIVGAWSVRQDGSLATRLLDAVDDVHCSLLDVELDRLSTFLDGTVVKPSFPTPLQKELSTTIG